MLEVDRQPRFTELQTFTKLNFLTDEECKHFIEIGKHDSSMKQSVVAGDKEGIVSEGRTGSNCWVPHNKTETTRKIAERISILVNIPLQYAESFQLIHYRKEQEYKPHFDGWKHDGSDKSRRMMTKKGQRLCTCLVYLNTPEEGGETVFPKLNMTVAAESGKLVYFSNVETNTNVLHPHSLHGGQPVKKGEKWAFNLWFRERYYK
jgi:prolyl 4-hydroxylase